MTLVVMFKTPFTGAPKRNPKTNFGALPPSTINLKPATVTPEPYKLSAIDPKELKASTLKP